MKADPDRARVMRQALAGMLWSKQYFHYDLSTWLKEHQVDPGTPPGCGSACGTPSGSTC